MPLTVQLMGRPSVVIDGRPGPRPRGRKAWALLAYLVLADRPPTRQELAELLFADADDPLGALRWSLAEVRRMLGPGVRMQGDPVVWDRDEHVVIDVLDALRRPMNAQLVPARGELLEGVAVATSPTFESWLVVERHRTSAAVEAALRRAALGALVAGDAREAVAFASGVVARNPLDEGNHVLLVRCLTAAGDRPAALRQVQICQDVLRREFGLQSSVALTDAAQTPLGSITRSASSGRSAALAQLEAGRAAIVAGAVDAGVDCLRRAVAEATAVGDRPLQAQALVALGSALVHAVRGFDDEGAVVLHEAIDVATLAGDAPAAAAAHRELGFVEVQAGRRGTADAWLRRAADLSESAGEQAAVLGIRGMNASDFGDYPSAFLHLQRSVELAVRADDARQEAWSLSILARAHLLCGQHADAARALDRSIDLVRAQRWLAFLPWPQALRAELALQDGREQLAIDEFEQSWALALQIGDPCWEGMAARGLALTSMRQNDPTSASMWLGEARTRCNRVSDRYQWVHGYVLDAMAGIALERGDSDESAALTDSLATLAARCEMRELVVRAHVHRANLGDRNAMQVARLLAAGIHNPTLDTLLGPADTGRTR